MYTVNISLYVYIYIYIYIYACIYCYLYSIRKPPFRPFSYLRLSYLGLQSLDFEQASVNIMFTGYSAEGVQWMGGAVDGGSII